MPKINELEWNTALTFADVEVEQVLKADANTLYKLVQEVEKLAKEGSADLAKFKIKEIWHLKDRTAILNMMKMYLATIKQSIPSLKMLSEKEPPSHVIVAMHSIILASKSLPCEKLHPVVKLIGSVYGKKFSDQAQRVSAAKTDKSESKEPLTRADERLQMLLAGGDITTEKVDTEYSRIRSRVMNLPRRQAPTPVPTAPTPSGPAPIASLMPDVKGPRPDGRPGSGAGANAFDGAGGMGFDQRAGAFGDEIRDVPTKFTIPAPIPVEVGGGNGENAMVSLFPIADGDAEDPPTGDICLPNPVPEVPANIPAINTSALPISMDPSIQDMLKRLNDY